ncbi:MAG: hypothetical protein WCQ64_13805 [Acidobacteriota bacterium]
MLATLSITLSLTLTGVPSAQPMRAQMRLAAQQAAAQAPVNQNEWQHRHDAAEARRRRGITLGVIGGAISIGALSASVVCTSGADGQCTAGSRHLTSGLNITGAVGAVIAVTGVVIHQRAKTELRALDAQRPR